MAELVKITKAPSFFKVLIMEDFSTHLQIPKAFVKTFGKIILSKEFQLQIDSDHIWKVEVANANERVYFQKGWEAFVKDNLLEYRDFVVFEYVGKSTFKVKMYGSHCCEKKVLNMATDHIHVESETTTSADEDHSKEEVDLCAHNKGKRKGVVEDVEDVIEMMKHQKSRSSKNKISREDIKGSSSNEVKTESRDFIYVDIDPPSDNELDECKGSVKKQRTNAGVEQRNTAIALEEAKRFKSNYPSFHVVLHHSYVNCSMYLPTMFYRTHMKEKIKNVKLEVSGRLWTVGLNNVNGCGKSNYVKFNAGWRVFSRDNKLKAGDVCVFEMRKRKNVLFEVHIFRC